MGNAGAKVVIPPVHGQQLRLGEYDVEIAYQRCQGRRQYQEDNTSIVAFTPETNLDELNSSRFKSVRLDYYPEDTPAKKSVKQPQANGIMPNDVNNGSEEGFQALPSVLVNDSELDMEPLKEDHRLDKIPADVDVESIWFGVFDGHGGSYAAEHLRDHMHETFLPHLPATLTRQPGMPLEQIMNETYAAVDAEVRALPPRDVEMVIGCPISPSCQQIVVYTDEAKNTGSTATTLLLSYTGNDVLINIANVGDSRLVLFTTRSGFHNNGQLNGQHATNTVHIVSKNETIAESTPRPVKHVDDMKPTMNVTSNGHSNRRIPSWQRVVEVVHETLDHNTSTVSERKRVLDAGHQIINNRLDGVIMVTRAIGDNDMKSRLASSSPNDKSKVNLALVSTPDVSSFSLRQITNVKVLGQDAFGKDAYAIIASDGLWALMSTETVMNFIETRVNRRFQAAASGASEKSLLMGIVDELMRHVVLTCGSVDNVSIVLVKITKAKEPDAEAEIEAEIDKNQQEKKHLIVKEELAMEQEIDDVAPRDEVQQ